MSLSWTKSAGLALAMFAAAGLAAALTPTHKLAEESGKINLEQIVPATFGDWKIDPAIIPVAASPDVQVNLNRLYNEILSRTYINTSGERVMLSIAYGGDQRDALQAHKPEVCYPAQGFQLSAVSGGVLGTRFGEIPVFRLETRHASRWEPVTYWITMGDKVVHGFFQRKLVELNYGLQGQIPDGLLFRVSSIDRNSAHAFQSQQKFVDDLLSALDPAQRTRLAGLNR